MSISVMSQVWKSSQHSGSELLLLLAIADNANDAGVAWPSITTLSEKTRMSGRQTSRLLKKLELSGELSVDRRMNTTSVYTVKVSGGDKMSSLKMSSPPDINASGRHDAYTSDESSIPITKPSLFEVERPTKSEALASVKEGLSKFVERIYKAYPRHKAKGAAEKAIRAAIKRVGEGEGIGTPSTIANAAAFLEMKTLQYANEREGENQQYTPYPASWFNAKSYLDLDGKPPAPVEQTNETQSTNKNAAELTRQQLSGGRR